MLKLVNQGKHGEEVTKIEYEEFKREMQENLKNLTKKRDRDEER